MILCYSFSEELSFLLSTQFSSTLWAQPQQKYRSSLHQLNLQEHYNLFNFVLTKPARGSELTCHWNSLNILLNFICIRADLDTSLDIFSSRNPYRGLRSLSISFQLPLQACFLCLSDLVSSATLLFLLQFCFSDSIGMSLQIPVELCQLVVLFSCIFAG